MCTFLSGKILSLETHHQPCKLQLIVYFEKTNRASTHQIAVLPKVACLCVYFLL